MTLLCHFHFVNGAWRLQTSVTRLTCPCSTVFLMICCTVLALQKVSLCLTVCAVQYYNSVVSNKLWGVTCQQWWMNEWYFISTVKLFVLRTIHRVCKESLLIGWRQSYIMLNVVPMVPHCPWLTSCTHRGPVHPPTTWSRKLRGIMILISMGKLLGRNSTSNLLPFKNMWKKCFLLTLNTFQPCNIFTWNK